MVSRLLAFCPSKRRVKKLLLKFLIVGGLGFLIDAGLTYFFMFLGLSAIAARPPAIAIALVCTWLMNRKFAFRVESSRSFLELAKYALVAFSVSLLNYLVYMLFIMSEMLPLLAIALATLVQSGASFFGYRRFVFRSGSK